MAVQKQLAAGLWISPSTLQAPNGSYTIADNTVCNTPGVLEPRRGYYWLPYDLSAPGSPYPKSSFSYNGYLLVQSDGSLAYNSGAAMVDYSPGFNPPSPSTLRMRSEPAGLNLYFTTLEGVYGLDRITNQPRSSGLPTGPLPTAINHKTALTGAPDTGWMPPDSQTAYVTTYFRTDSNETTYEGTPSNAIFVTNSATTIAAGDADNDVGGNVTITYTNQPYSNGDVVQVTFAAADTDFASGVYTVSAASTNTFVLAGAGGPSGPSSTTLPAQVSFGSRDVIVYVELPGDVVAGQTILVYRSLLSDSQDAVPRAQYYLDKEYIVDGSDVTAGYFTYTDSTPDALLQDALYTNTDDGEPPDSSLQNDNGQAPWCLDLAEFDQRLWGSNYEELQTFPLSLLGVGSPNGLQVGDTVSILGQLLAPPVTFTAVAEVTATPGPQEFRVYTSSGSPAENVQNTAQELTQVISAVPWTLGAVFEAIYTSGPDSLLRGQMLIRCKTPGRAVFYVYASRPSAWSPILTTTGVDPVASTSAPQTNGLWFSKQNQPESVPLLNRMSIGPRNCSILRIRPLRDKLYVFTDIAGVYTVANSYPYQVTSLSSTAVLVGPDTLVNFDDAIYALTTQGVVRFNEAGPTILSVPIESELKALFGVGLANLRIKAFALGYESYRKYMLAMPTTVEDTNNTQVFVYDVITKDWTRYTKAMDSGTVIPQTDTLYVTTPLSTKVSVERKNYNRTDYSDEDFQVTITAADGLAVTLTSTIAPQAGDLLYQSPILRSLITAVETMGANTYAVTMQDTIDWTFVPPTLGGEATFATFTPPGGGSLRNDFGGWVGFKFLVGVESLDVTAVGRYIVGSSTDFSHDVKIIETDGTVVASGTIAAGAHSADTFAYDAVSVTLSAGTSYYILSREVNASADTWYDDNTGLTAASSVAAITGSAYQVVGSGPSDASAGVWNFGPPNFKYTTAAPEPSGPATCYPGIQCIALNTPLFATGPEERKNFREVTFHFRTPGFSLGNGLFAGDTNPYIQSVAFSLGGWGEVAWGLFAWEQPGRPVNKRVAIPTNARRVSYLSVGFAIREAQSVWQMMGVTPIYENMSERNTK